MSQIFLNNPVWVKYKPLWMQCNFYFFRRLKTGKKLAKAVNQITFMMCCFASRERNRPNKHTQTKLMWNHCQRLAWLRNANVALRDTLSRIYQKGSSHSKHQTVSRYTRKSNFMLGSTKCVLPAPTFATNTKVQQYYMHMPKKHNLNQIGQ